MLKVDFRDPKARKTVLIVDEHPIVRRGVRAFIELLSGYTIIGEVDGGAGAIAAAVARAPDIVVMDLPLPRFAGVETLRALLHAAPAVRVLVFTLHRSERLLWQAMEAGAMGYVCKAESEHIVPALEALARGDRYVSPSVGDSLLAVDEARDPGRLTAREQQIVALAAEGHTNKECARLLRISVKTVETHRAAAMRKTGTRSLSALTLYAARNGLVTL